MTMSSDHTSFLVSADWLETHLHDAGLRIFDCTGILGAD